MAKRKAKATTTRKRKKTVTAKKSKGSKRVKLLKFPKKPKRSSSVSVLKNFFKRCEEIKRENARRISEEKQRTALLTKLRNYRPGSKY